MDDNYMQLTLFDAMQDTTATEAHMEQVSDISAVNLDMDWNSLMDLQVQFPYFWFH